MAQLEAHREELRTKLQEYQAVSKQLTALRDQKLDTVESLVDMGEGFCVSARVPDTSKVMVNVGLGTYVEYTQAEAIDFCDSRADTLCE